MINTTAGHPRRRGSAYVLVLTTLSLVGITALAGLSLSRSQRAAATRTNDAAEARLLARTGIEIAVHHIAHRNAWRTLYANSAVVDTQIGDATIHTTLIDTSDGVLNNGDDHPVTVRSTAAVGDARQTTQITLNMRPAPLDSLEASLFSGGSIGFVRADVTADAPIVANLSIVADRSNIHADVEAAGSIAGSEFHETTSDDASSRTLPTSTTVFEIWSSRGTRIEYDDLDEGELSDISLTATENPYGPTNAQGIYIIDCGGEPIAISDIEIEGTLILLNAGYGSSIYGEVRLTTPTPEQPVLLVDGDLAWGIVPDGKPHPYTDGTDRTFSVSGIVYVDGSLAIDRPVSVQGTVLASGSIAVAADLELGFMPQFIDPPPAGFEGGFAPIIVRGSWQRILNN